MSEPPREIDAWLRALYSVSPLGIGFFRDGVMLSANAAYVKLFGYQSQGELVGRPLRDQIAPSAGPDIVHAIAAGDQGATAPAVYEARGLRKDGSEFPFACRVARAELPDGPVSIVFVEDITDQAQTEVALRQSEARLRTITDSLADTILQTDRQGRITFVNHLVPGLPLEQVLQATAFDFVPPEQRPIVERALAAVFNQAANVRYESLGPGPDGTSRLYEVSVAPVVDREVVAAVFVARDVTERKHAEEALRQSEERYRMVFENSGTANAIFDTDCRLVLQNSLSVERLGLSPEQARGKSALELFGPKVGAAVEERMRGVLQSGTPASYETEFELHDGSRWFHSSYQPVKDENGAVRGVQVISQEITALKRLEAEREKLQADLFQAHKMEAIGTLAGGVAHDFNNILAGMLGGLSLLDLGTRSAAEQRAVIQDMKALAKRGADLAKQLLGFGRRGKVDARPLDLCAVATETSAIFARTRPDITIRLQFAPGVWAVLMDHAQAEQVLLNLLVNAGQAMPDGGQLDIRAANASLAAGQAARLGLAAGRFVEVVVADNGVGMDEATRSRIFEPFFTTKATGTGSGLGLASVYGIVKNHGGMIEVDSAPGQGAAFTILLPATDQTATKEEPLPATTHVGSGTILVVDDEELIRKVLVQLLSEMGYHVLAVAGGREAVELLREQREPITLVILDLTMPGMSGAMTYEALRAVAPDVKVLLSSGYAIDGQAQQLLARGCSGFIQKPFDADTLAAKLEALLSPP